MLEHLDPQAQMVLEQLRANASTGPNRALPFSAAEKISAMRKRMADIVPFGFPFESVLRIEDIEIQRSEGKIRLRLYVPQTQDPLKSAAPVLIYYHGGGLVAGGLDWYDTVVRALANRGRCIVVAVGYRLAPENPYPAASDDAWTALRWVTDQASEIRADPRRLAVGGDSTGGFLAAGVAQKAANIGLPLGLQVLLYPSLDAIMSRPSWAEFGGGDYVLSHSDMLAWYDAYLPSKINREDPSVSPFFATDLSGLAPAFIVTTDHDPLRDEGNEYASRLTAANIAVDHTC